jgi:hypothetical protein
MAMSPSTTPGFSAMPPRVRSRVWSLIGIPLNHMLPLHSTHHHTEYLSELRIRDHCVIMVLLVHLCSTSSHPVTSGPDGAPGLSCIHSQVLFLLCDGEHTLNAMATGLSFCILSGRERTAVPMAEAGRHIDEQRCDHPPVGHLLNHRVKSSVLVSQSHHRVK